jgi:hypothetical protein
MAQNDMGDVVTSTTLPPKVSGPLQGELVVEILSVSMDSDGHIPHFTRVHWWGKEGGTVMDMKR